MEPKQTSSDTTQSSVQPIGPAVVLTGMGVILLLAAVFSNQWLEIVNWRESYDWRGAHVGPIGLFSDVSSHGAGFRMPIAVLLLFIPLWLFVGMFRRWALHGALACAFSGAVVASIWVFTQSDMGAGRAYTLAMIGLATIAGGVTQALMVPIMRTGRNVLSSGGGVMRVVLVVALWACSSAPSASPKSRTGSSTFVG